MAQYVRQWLVDKRVQVRPNTYRAYEWLVRVHVIPGVSHIKLDKLRPPHLQSLYTRLATGEKPLSARSIQEVHVIIHDALKRAVKWGLVSRNVADVVDPPRIEKRQPTIWTSEQVRVFLAASQTDSAARYAIGFLLAVTTGMRKGELLALRWSDVDLDVGQAYVNRSMTWIRGEALFQEPKTTKSRRAVALLPETIVALRAHKLWQTKERVSAMNVWQHNDLVLCRADGKPYNPKTFDDAWYRAMVAAGVPCIRFHDLRHTHASLMLMKGVHPKIVSERLGHSNISITLDTYSHVIPGMQKQVAAAFDDVLIPPQNDATKKSR